jgi:hypothetical protein
MKSTGSQAAEVSLRERKAQSSCIYEGSLIDLLDEIDEMKDLVLVLENSIGFVAHDYSGGAEQAVITRILRQRLQAIQDRITRQVERGEKN